MSHPHNWYEMTWEQRQAWEKEDRARRDLEYDREEAQRAAERATSRAAEAERRLKASRAEAADEISEMNDRYEDLREELSDVREMLLSLVGISQRLSVEFPPSADLPPLVELRQWLATFAHTPEGQKGGDR